MPRTIAHPGRAHPGHMPHFLHRAQERNQDRAHTSPSRVPRAAASQTLPAQTSPAAYPQPPASPAPSAEPAADRGFVHLRAARDAAFSVKVDRMDDRDLITAARILANALDARGLDRGFLACSTPVARPARGGGEQAT